MIYILLGIPVLLYLLVSLLVYNITVMPIIYSLREESEELESNKLFAIKQSLLWPLWLWR